MRFPRIVIMTLVLAAQPAITAGQEVAGMPLIGVLSPDRAGVEGCAAPNLHALLHGLSGLGWVAGKNVRIEFRCLAFDFASMPAAAIDLVRLRPDVIFTYTTNGVVAARAATQKIPIVVGRAGDLVEQGIVANYAKPGGNITGVTIPGVEFNVKLVQLVKEAVPAISRIALLTNPANPVWSRVVDELPRRASDVAVEILPVKASTIDEVRPAFAQASSWGAGAMLVLNDVLFGRNAAIVGEEALARGLPAIAQIEGFAAAGGLIAYHPDYAELDQRAATYIDKILRGAKPGDLPLEQATRFKLIVNLKTAKTLGLTIPNSVLARADEVIE